MVKLVTPNDNTKMVRFGEFWNHKKWHFIEKNRTNVGICGILCHDPEFTTLKEIESEEYICYLCWPFRSGRR